MCLSQLNFWSCCRQYLSNRASTFSTVSALKSQSGKSFHIFTTRWGKEYFLWSNIALVLSSLWVMPSSLFLNIPSVQSWSCILSWWSYLFSIYWSLLSQRRQVQSFHGTNPLIVATVRRPFFTHCLYSLDVFDHVWPPYLIGMFLLRSYQCKCPFNISRTKSVYPS